MNPPIGPFRYTLLVRGKELDLAEGEATLGRSRAATVSIVDPSLSRVHARLHLREGRVTLEDLGSSNGTYVNGIRLMAKAELSSGDRVTIGETDVEVRIQEVVSENATRRIDPRQFLCSRCGRPFAEEAKFCAACGQPRPSADASSSPSLPSGSSVPAVAGPIDLPLGDVTRLAPAAARRPADLLPAVELEPLPPRAQGDSGQPEKPAPGSGPGGGLGRLFRR